MTPERGLYDSDEDLAAYLARITGATGLEPKTAGYEHTFAPGVQARINAEIQPQLNGAPTITPSIGATLGPLSLNGGLQLAPATTDDGNPYTRVTPTFGAGLKVPIGGGDASAAINITPDQQKIIEAAYKRKLLGGDLDLNFRHTQPTEGRPDDYVGARWSRELLMPDTTTLAEIKISELPVAPAANTTDQLEANQAGVSRSITVAQIAASVPVPPADWSSLTGKPTIFPPDPEAVDDRVAALIVAGANMTATYNDAANTLTLASTAAGGGGGTVTSTSVVSANGLAGTVATATTTPAITLSTTITGMLKGNGTAISAATAGTDYVTPAGLPTSLPPSGAAGGALAGTYPNPTLVGGPLSNYALTSSIPTTLPPNGAASGDLAGSYPAPTIKASVGLTGTPTAPTPGAVTSTEIVNAAWVLGKGYTASAGTVTTASVVSANGFAGTVANPTTTPAITLSTTITGMLKGNGTAISAATAGTDYLSPSVTSLITTGYTVTPNNIGTVSSGTTTLAGASGNYQYLTNNGAFTLAAPAADCAISLLVTNGASAGAITFSGFTVGATPGDALTTTNTSKFLVSIVRINAISTYMIKALQ